MTIQNAIICAFIYWLMRYLDNCTSWDAMARPIVVAPFIGLALGDMKTGIVMGASLEAVFMGISAIGGSIPSDGLSATVISVAYAITVGGADAMETGLALAMTIGTLMSSFSSMFTPVWASFAPLWEKEAEKCNPGRFALLNWIMEGVNGLQAFLDACPAFIMTGLAASGKMMTAVGFGILLAMIWNKEIAVFYFIGFIFAESLGLSSLGIAVIAAGIALTIFFIEKHMLDLSKNTIKNEDKDAKNTEEEFF